MDANAILDSIAKNVLYQIMIASPHVDAGDIEPSELSDEEIARDLDFDALLQIQKALRAARWQIPAVTRRAQETANQLIRVLEKHRQIGLAERKYETGQRSSN